MDWLDSMQRIRAIKLELARLDPRGGMPIAPSAGASPAAIEGAERRLGIRLPPSYRALLAMHDGWTHLYAGASLLGVRALSRGTFVGVARMVITGGDGEEDDAAAAAERAARIGKPRRGGSPINVLPFGIDAEGETVFAWDLEATRGDGEFGVVLWTNDIGLRLPSFPALLEFVMEMLSAELDDRRRCAAALTELTPEPRSAIAHRPRAQAAAPRAGASRPPARSAMAG